MNRSDAPPNAFEAGKAGTAGRDLAEASIEELRQRGGMFVEAVRATRMPMALTDPNLPGNPIVFANEAFLRLSGYAMAEVLGQQPHFMNGRKTDPQDSARFAEALRSDQDDIIETIQYRKDGSTFVATVLISAFKDDEGHTLNHFMSWLDVTRRVDAESEVAELKETQAALSEELKNTVALQKLGAGVVPQHDVQTIYEDVLTAAIEITGGIAGTVQMLDSETDELVILATRGFGAKTNAYFHRVDAGSNTSCGAALRSGERAYFNFDRASADKAACLHVGDGIISAQSTPLLARTGRPIGMVSTHWNEADRRLSEREIRFLDLLARQAADLIERNQAHAALIDEQRRQKTLLGELQHRVRNTLAVIKSIVRRTAASADTVESLEQHLEGRLNAFARTQAHVTRDPDGSVDLELIVRDELLAHAAGHDEDISIAGPEVRLSTKQAETLGLAIHELTSNAIKYGALSDDGNKIAVRWSLEGKGDKRRLRFKWEERLAGRKLEKPSRTGFGTELLERVISYELDAEPQLEFNSDGLSYRVDIPFPPDSATH